MTDTLTTETVSLDRDSLTLVIVSPDYFQTGEQNHLMPNGDEESRTYYATTSRLMGNEWATLIDPVDRGRLSGWDATHEYRDLVGENHNGWNIRRQYLSPVSTGRPFIETDAARRQEMTKEAAYPIGSRWNHFLAGEATVLGHEASSGPLDVRVLNDGREMDWVRGALDLDSTTFVGWDGETTAPVIESRPFQAGDVVQVGDRVRLVVAEGDGDSHAVVGDLGIVTHVDGGPRMPVTLIDVVMDDGHTTHRCAYRFAKVSDAPETHATGPETGAETTGEVFTSEADSDSHTGAGTEARAFTREDLDRAVREAREEARQAMEEFKEMANERAVQYAEDNSLCSQFERCMEDIGLMGREEWHEAHQTDYKVTFRVTMSVSANDRDDAYETARENLYEDLSYPQDQTIELVEVEEV